jgi:hypothetical protein
LNAFLASYRATPHSSTAKPPAEIIFQRRFKTHLPQYDFETKNTTLNSQELQQTDQLAKGKMKHYADRYNHTKHRHFAIDDLVLVRQPKVNKYSSYFQNRPYTVVAIKGSMATARRNDNKLISRDASFFKLFKRVPFGMTSALPNNLTTPHSGGERG